MSELIDKQVAIAEVEWAMSESISIARDDWRAIVEALKEVPPAQTEIIRCRDCKYSATFPFDSGADMPMKCLGIRYGGVYPYWYCEHAERRTDE